MRLKIIKPTKWMQVEVQVENQSKLKFKAMLIVFFDIKEIIIIPANSKPIPLQKSSQNFVRQKPPQLL